MFKTLFTLLFCLAVCQTVFAQDSGETDTLICYVDKNNSIIINGDSAVARLVIYPRDRNASKKLYPFREYYLNGKTKSVGNSTVHSPYLILDGPLLTFFPNGKRQNSMNFVEGKLTGIYIQNYISGKLYSVQEFSVQKGLRYLECRDTLGNILAENGNGKWLELDADRKKPTNYVDVTDGILGSKWYPIIDSINYAYYNSTGKVFSDAFIRPQFIDNKGSNLTGFIERNLFYPPEDEKNRITGSVDLDMIVEKDGSLTHLKIIKAPSDALAGEALRLIGISSPWLPGSATDSNSVDRVKTELTLNFGLSIAKNKSTETTIPHVYVVNKADDLSTEKAGMIDTLYAVDQQPEFPGGLEKFGQFLATNLRYPQIDRDNGTSGRVIVRFTIEEDGSLSNITAIRGPSEGLKKEAVRVIRRSPKWKPGMANNKPIKVSYTVPVAFETETVTGNFLPMHLRRRLNN
jgi:TonB family protein